MEDLNYISLLGKEKVLGNCFVELWDFSAANDSDESRVEAVTTVAAECWGSTPKDRQKLYERLSTESAGSPSSAFEFVRTHDFSIETSLRNVDNQYTDDRLFNCLELDALHAHHLNNVATFRMRLPIFIIRQIVRHRQFSYQELSRRIPIKDSLEFWGVSESVAALLIEEYNATVAMTGRPEIARAVLPLGMLSNIWMQGDVDAFANYFKLRLDIHAQAEHRSVAASMLCLVKKHQPIFYDAVIDANQEEEYD